MNPIEDYPVAVETVDPADSDHSTALEYPVESPDAARTVAESPVVLHSVAVVEEDCISVPVSR